MTVPQLRGRSTTCSTARTRRCRSCPTPRPQQILYIQENQGLFPGVQATTMSVRTYSAMGKAAANIVGYVGQISQTQYQQAEGRRATSRATRSAWPESRPSTRASCAARPGVTKAAGRLAGQRARPPSARPSRSRATTCGSTIDGNIQMIAETALEQGLVAARHTFDHVDAPA